MSTNKEQSPYAIECNDLHFSYSFKPILSGVNLAIPQGAVVGLIGANGSGKSSLLRCIVGLQTPQSGEARLFGTPALAIDDDIRERLGFVAQSADLFPWLTVEKHIKMIGQAYPRWQERRALELAIRLRLPMTREVSQLSGGDQQKLSVVLALAHQPDIIIMDEPVSSLDPMTRRDFMRSLFQDAFLGLDQDTEASNDQQTNYQPTILISSHLLSDLERVISHVAFIRDGRVQLYDEWDKVLEFVRILAKSEYSLPSAICIAENRDQQVIDLRHFQRGLGHKIEPHINIAHLESTPAIGNLDDLFIAFNS